MQQLLNTTVTAQAFQTAPRSGRKMPTFLYLLKCSETSLSKQMTAVSTSAPRYSHRRGTVLHSHTSCSCLWQERTPQVSAELHGSPSNMKFKVFAHKVSFTAAKGKKINVVFPLQAVRGNSIFKMKLQDTRCKINFD